MHIFNNLLQHVQEKHHSKENRKAEEEEDSRDVMRALGVPSLWYFRLDDGALVWNKENNTKNSNMSLPLSQITQLHRGILFSPKATQELIISIVVKKGERVITLKADSVAQATTWFTALKRATFQLGVPPLPYLVESLPSLLTSGDIKTVSNILRMKANTPDDATNLKDLTTTSGGSLLYEAVCRSHANLIPLLLTHGFSANDMDPSGYSMVHLASHMGSHQVLAELLQDPSSSSTVNALAPDNNSTLHAAYFTSSLPCMEILLGKGAFTSLTDIYGRTVLHWAAEGGDSEAVGLLLSWVDDGDVDLQDREGNSALHLACSRGHIQTAAQLLETAANPLLVNRKKLSPLSIALSLEYSHIAKLLMDYGGGGMYPPTIDFQMEQPHEIGLASFFIFES
jgi:ankyrin repeat protein